MAAVKLGDREVVIEPFKGYKAKRVGRLVARLSKHVPEFIDQMAEFRRDYATKHYRRITKGMALQRAIPNTVEDDKIPEDQRAALQASLDRVAAGYQALLDGELQDKDHVDLPEEPSGQEVVLAVFGKAWDIAEEETLEVLALLVAPNADLRQAYRDDGVEEYLKDLADDLMFDANVEDLVELAVVGVETIRAQFAGKAGAVGKLISLLSSTDQATPESPSPAAQQETPTTSTPPSPSSSTDSPEPTGGAPDERSSELAGASSVT